MIGLCILVLWPLAGWLWTPDRPLEFLRSKYLARPGDMLRVASWHLHLTDTGPRDAPALVLIHGFGSSLQTWDAWVPGLEATHRVVRFDLPGSGLSPPDPSDDYSDARSLALVLAVLNRLGLKRASIAGHSIGGRIAWKFAAAHPERVDRLVLLAPDGFASPGWAYGKAPAVPAALGLMRYVMPRPLLRMNLAAAYADPARLTDELVGRYDDLLRAPGVRQALLERLRQTILVDPRPLLARVQAPTLLVWGERDAMIPNTNSADYLKVMPNARLVLIAGSGHLPQEEAAGESLARVESFLVE